MIICTSFFAASGTLAGDWWGDCFGLLSRVMICHQCFMFYFLWFFIVWGWNIFGTITWQQPSCMWLGQVPGKHQISICMAGIIVDFGWKLAIVLLTDGDVKKGYLLVCFLIVCVYSSVAVEQHQGYNSTNQADFKQVYSSRFFFNLSRTLLQTTILWMKAS